MTATKEKQRQKILLIVLGVVVVVTLVVLYFTVWKNGKSIVIDNTLEQEISGGGTQEALASNLSGLEEKLKKVDLNLDFLNQIILPFLRLYGNVPVQKGTTGRPNPFIP